MGLLVCSQPSCLWVPVSVVPDESYSQDCQDVTVSWIPVYPLSTVQCLCSWQSILPCILAITMVFAPNKFSSLCKIFNGISHNLKRQVKPPLALPTHPWVFKQEGCNSAEYRKWHLYLQIQSKLCFVSYSQHSEFWLWNKAVFPHHFCTQAPFGFQKKTMYPHILANINTVSG
jgi:hypothetical protein